MTALVIEIRDLGLLKQRWDGCPAAFVVEEPLLSVETAAVTRQRAGRADHAVARDDNGQGVGAVGESDGTGAVVKSERYRDLAVRPRLSRRDSQELLPDPALEVRAVHRERHGARIGRASRE